MLNYLKNLFGFGTKAEVKVEKAAEAPYKVEAPVVVAPATISPEVEPVVAAKPKKKRAPAKPKATKAPAAAKPAKPKAKKATK